MHSRHWWEHRSLALCCCCDGWLCMPEQMQQCLTGAQEEPGSRLSVSLMGVLLHDWAARALIGPSVLTAWLVGGQSANKIKLYFINSSSFMDYAGGLRRLWLWEQAPCSDSFCSRLDEGWSPALTLSSAPHKEVENISWRQPQHHCGHFCYTVLFVLIYFHILSQFIILKRVQYTVYWNVLWENSYKRVLLSISNLSW